MKTAKAVEAQKPLSQFGSHASMVLSDDELLLFIVQHGWHPTMNDKVVCRDEHGLYLTEAKRLDDGLADTNRHNSVNNRFRFI